MQALALSSSTQMQRCTGVGSFAARQRLAAAPRRQLAVSAQAIKPPQGVTLPPRNPVTIPSTFGFVENAEKLNSRAAMIGFFALLLVELVAGAGLLDLMGVTTGNGLGFEF